MRDWVVGGGVIEVAALDVAPAAAPGGACVLLVENLRRNGTADWTPPGGVIDAGEPVVEGLTREVAEETGLVVTRWDGPIYEIEAEAPGLGWRLRVEVHRAVEVTGELRTGADPDGIVVGADWVAAEECAPRLVGAHPWVREPLLDWLGARWHGSRTYRYRVEGEHPERLTIERR